MIDAKLKEDMVNHPKHYAGSCSIECIDSMVIAFGAVEVAKHCVITAYKYIWRCEFKNKLEDLQKSQWYVDKFFDLYKDWNFEEYQKDIDEFHEKAEHMQDVILKLKKKIK